MTVRQTVGFLTLCLLASSSWLTAGLLPASPIAGYGFRLLLVGVGGLLVYFSRRNGARIPALARCGWVGLASLGLIGIPLLLLGFADGRVSSSDGVIVFACMPVLLTVIGAASSVDSGLRLLPYGLLGAAGVLVLLPMSVPQGLAGALGVGALLAAMVFTSISLIWLHRLLNGFSIVLAVSLAGLVNGSVLVLAGGPFGITEWDLRGFGIEVTRLLLDLTSFALLLWLSKVVTPQRLSVQYLVTPLLTVIEGWVVFRPGLDGRTILGVILLGAGASLSFRAGDIAVVPTLTLWRRDD